MTFVLGLTGGIATGKSSASSFFKKKGIPVVDADIGAREIMEPGQKTYAKVIGLFGDTILNENRTIDRKKLGSIVFNDKDKMDQLNAVVRKDIYDWIQKEKEGFINSGYPLIVLDIPLLYEAGYDSEVDAVMVIVTNEATQLKRLMERDNISESEAISRIKSQHPISSKQIKADIVIDNNGTIEQTYEQLNTWLTQNGY
ncbi:dephospho-CoA kinase [Alkalibacterium olivapovliticus]|uniref:Dephospho-CoA kinase n=1 Tax=Alkalibacterium olivapovliticus TaxID=99907 RepID=A0A2T0WBC6_9LACT|nr:dephospho-CoA kinase [Alkalibacterium olivapovliticus]PRY84002.1 dephospho-CoA kinase [Alkalibacterium olivapovliticus]